MSEPLDKSDLLSTQMKCQGPTLDRKMRNSVCKPGSCIIMKFQAFLPVKKSFGISIQWCKLGVGDDAANLQRSAMKGLNFIGILNLNLSFNNQRKSFQEKNYCSRQISTRNRGYCKLRQGVINKLDVFRYYFHCCHYSLKIITGFLADC